MTAEVRDGWSEATAKVLYCFLTQRTSFHSSLRSSQSYLGVCGEGGVEGDGVVPLRAAHLDGGTHVSLGEDGGFHSVNEPQRWYGSEMGVEKWLATMEGLVQRQ